MGRHHGRSEWNWHSLPLRCHPSFGLQRRRQACAVGMAAARTKSIGRAARAGRFSSRRRSGIVVLVAVVAEQ